MSAIKYPSVRRDESCSETLHGKEIADPYRWLEDPDSEETQQFVQAQQEITTPFLESFEDRERIKEQLTEYYNYEKVGCPFRVGSRFFFYRNSGLQNHSVLYYRENIDSEPVVFVDPNEWSEDGTTSLAGTAFSKDGTHVVLTIGENGSDWRSAKFMTVDDKKYLEDKLERVKFSSFAWTHDNSGVFYCAFDKSAEGEKKEASNKNQKLFFHRLGTSQSEDILIYSCPEQPEYMFGPEVTDDGDQLLIYVRESCEPKNLLYFVSLKGFDGTQPITEPLNKLIDTFDDEYDYITNAGDLYYFQTKEEFICIDLAHPERDNWKTLIPKGEDTLEAVCCFDQNKIAVTFLHDVKSVLKLYHLESGELINIVELPSIGAVSSISGRKEFPELFYKFTSFTYPGTIYSYDTATNVSTLFYETSVSGFSPDRFEMKQVFYTSKDGTQIPMFLYYPKGFECNGEHIAYLYGYGGFDISLTPWFSAMKCAFAEGYNAVVAVANIRGGGEYGPRWHKAAVKTKRQTAFDDFMAAAEYLVQEKYTSASRLVISGGSNGGLLVAACMNQRPELFGAVICSVGVLDMLRFHKFTIGHYWVSDYGCADNEEEFHYLLAYSPYHTIRADGREFPSTLLCTADHDDRVVPAHSFKYIAALQHALGEKEYQKNPLLIRIESKAGHGAGKPTSKVIEEQADEYAFIGKVLKGTWKSH